MNVFSNTFQPGTCNRDILGLAIRKLSLLVASFRHPGTDMAIGKLALLAASFKNAEL